jgi:hypothetical protein
VWGNFDRMCVLSSRCWPGEVDLLLDVPRCDEHVHRGKKSRIAGAEEQCFFEPVTRSQEVYVWTRGSIAQFNWIDGFQHLLARLGIPIVIAPKVEALRRTVGIIDEP